MPTTYAERTQMAHLEQDLLRLYAAVPPERVRAEVNAGMRSFRDARVRVFVPVLVAKRVKDRLGTVERPG